MGAGRCWACRRIGTSGRFRSYVPCRCRRRECHHGRRRARESLVVAEEQGAERAAGLVGEPAFALVLEALEYLTQASTSIRNRSGVCERRGRGQ